MICPLCERDAPDERMERHHMQTRRKDRFDVELICGGCHRNIHALFTNGELRDPALGLHTVEGLLAEPSFARAVAFLQTLPPGRHPRTRTSNRRKGRSRRRG